MRPGILTLTTDFGAEGPYVAAMKGVVLGLAPGTCLVDVSHSIAPQNILEGAYILASIHDAFPAGTIHLAVVDPGVGTERKLIAARVGSQWYVLPDNGLLCAVLCGRSPDEVYEITNPAIRRRVVSLTFHGRDILAPAAAFLLQGGTPAELGPPLPRLVRLANVEPRPDEAGGFVAEVIFRDSFGNLITNLAADRLAGVDPAGWSFRFADRQIDGLSRAYGDHPPGTLVALVGSTGWVELALVNGDAARQLGAGSGTTVWVRRR
jgi:S-adenosylmethionine hydrolase